MTYFAVQYLYRADADVAAVRPEHRAYLATIVVLVIISRDRKLLQNNLPASLGKPFLP